MREIYPLNSFNLAGIVVFTGFLNACSFGCLFIYFDVILNYILLLFVAFIAEILKFRID